MDEFITKLRKPKLTQRLWKRIRSYFFLDQWILLIAKDIQERNPSWDDFTRIAPPPDRIWADPFIWACEDNFYVFFEEQPIDTKRGHICCLTVNNNLEVIANRTVLDLPYHLSYPFLFEYKDVLHMLPETGENRTIEIYRCTRFPDQWEKVKTLMTGVYAVDSTLLESNGKWWLFTNIAKEGGSTWDTLYLFYADHPLSDNWIPHPQNPIVNDIHLARPAGQVYFDGTGFIRPSQDCSVRYGYATNFNRISQLSENEYAEHLEWKFRPIPKDIHATHTWNRAGNVCVIDAKITRSKF
jgi:hypothetical protein